MPFLSILFDEPAAAQSSAAPDYFSDLNLDQIVETVTHGRDEYELKVFFYAPLARVESIRYRQAVMRDLEEPAVRAAVEAFAKQMRAMRAQLVLAAKLYYPRQRQRCFLDAAEIYCDAVGSLDEALSRTGPRSDGFTALREYLTGYIGSFAFGTLRSEAKQLKSELLAIRYRLHIDGPRITVSPYAEESDYGEQVLQTFAKFKQGEVSAYDFRVHTTTDMNHVEAAILDLVAQLYPDTFRALEQYAEQHRDYLDPTIGRFDREVQFYLAWLEHVGRLRRAGLNFCYPEVSRTSKDVRGEGAFDLALAHQLTVANGRIVANDFYLEHGQRVFVVTGANQGGKTTFARMFGQLHYLACLGCLVPGRSARLFHFDQLFTHFEREEDLQNLSGKLESDLVRLQAILARATANSVLIMNESLSATTLRDALWLGKNVMTQIIERDMLCVFVTFLEELASLGAATVSMVSAVDSQNPVLRTFKLERRPPDGRAHALALASKYGLTFERVAERIGR
jgi:DNA mismatch repair protein MutS